MAAVLKLKYQGEVYRVLIGKHEVTYEGVREAIAKALPGQGTARAQYLDEEGDLCTLCKLSFSDFLATCGGVAGRQVLKLELTAPAPATACVEAAAGQSGDADAQGPAGHWKEHCKAHFEGLAKNWQAPKDQWESHWQQKCGGDQGGGDWFLRPKKLLWVLARLRATEALNGKTVAALAVYWLPKMIAGIARNSNGADRKIRKHMAALRPTLVDLRELVKATHGLEHCEAQLAALLVDDAPAGDALLALLTALDLLPFEAKVSFVETLFASQEERLDRLLDLVDQWTPWWTTSTLEHRAVCDGCNMDPLRGPRFRCSACLDYDLCAECFTKKTSVHGGEAAGHGFECNVTGHEQMWHAAAMKGMWGFPGMGMAGCKGNGKAGIKGKGRACFKGKGKGRCKGYPGAEAAACGEQEGAGCGQVPKACADGCGYAATWHPTHCCALCSLCGQHGPKCQRQLFPETTEDAHSPCEEPPMPGTDEEELVAAAPDFDLSFPVEVEDGRRLKIQWNHGEEPQKVAGSFALQHGIRPDEVPSIVAFVAHASEVAASQHAAAGTGTEDKEATGEMTEEAYEGVPLSGGTEHKEAIGEKTEGAFEEEVRKLQEMGFGIHAEDSPAPEVLRKLLQDHDGDIQKVIATLLG